MRIEYYVESEERSSHTGREVAYMRSIEKFKNEIKKIYIQYVHAAYTWPAQ